ncbi:MAG: secondary thiamine-phosphate synthase enzyme YjbQ [Candidatus Micrarchaeota archaeon]|nr:secondary thiamine-phosphate synthase enzyme YjbQ [Candidatus Micrarchaeota archaeon]
MKSGIRTISLRTGEGTTITNITGKIACILDESGVKQGQLAVYTRHTTTGIVINECEERLIGDFVSHLERIAPKSLHYMHDDLHLRICPQEERKNGHSHMKALFVPSSQAIPVNDGRMLLGKWQSVLFIDFDGAREREIVVQWIGD